jgi:hypothetical protein
MMLSLGRQTVNELLQQLEQEKIIHCQHGGLRILDPSRPRDAAQAARKGAALQVASRLLNPPRRSGSE